ncbi:MAG: hypothetical protein HZB84_00680 [Deltaproteobacteria bacterium]|nr:hypothetical protein [Deltaproteobacteria bacterium]
MRHALNAPRTLEINKRHHPPVFNKPLKKSFRGKLSVESFPPDPLQRLIVAEETLPDKALEGLLGKNCKFLESV